MTLSLNPHLIRVSMTAKNKTEAINQLTDLLVAEKIVSNHDAFVADVFFRESEGKTGIGNGVAIPHAKSPEVTSPSVAIGVLENGIEWESIDDKPVKCIILFAAGDSAEGTRDHLKLLSSVARKLGNDDVIKTLTSATTVQDVVTALQ